MSAALSPTRRRNAAETVRRRIQQGGERLWRMEDFKNLPFAAVAQALSRLARKGIVDRLSKGLYYHPRMTALGRSRPNPAAVMRLASRRTSIFPAGVAAANLLGFTTQNPRRAELSTSATSVPRKLLGPDTVVHTRRPDAWTRLSGTDAAMLEFLRDAGETSDLPPDDTIQRTLRLLAESGRFNRLARVARTEPPRVRALLGALGERLGFSGPALNRLRRSLNPLTRFNFGIFRDLPNAAAWQAKEPSGRATL